MSPFTIDEERMQSKPKPGEDTSILISLDPHKPPVKSIPHMEFPRIVYKHPREAFTTIEHRNARHEVVEEEVVPTEHLTMSVKDKTELEKALKSGWLKEPYIPETPPAKTESLYDGEPKKQA